MDRKPQRPIKTLRVGGVGDENAIKPELQKHKSLGTLVGNSVVGGLRATGKRNALGDLGNAGQNIGSVQDDSALNAKCYDVKKVQTATNTLARPPMRSIAFQNQPLPTNKQAQASKFAVPSKRSNAVFKDSEEAVAKDQAHESDIGLLAVNSKKPSLGEYFDNDQSKTMEENFRVAPLRVEQMRQEEEDEQAAQEAQVYQTYLVALQELADKQDASDCGGAVVQAGDADPDEIWEVDEEEDEQDYTTAHSFRSRGDNTTGGVTTVSFPKYTIEDRDELEEAAELVMATLNKDDVEDEAWDTSMVAEYAEDIFEYMRQQEVEYLAPWNYMRKQVEIQWSMRSVLMEWIVQVHQRFQLLPETLYLCVNCIDRFLTVKVVSLGKLQLVGATALFIAAKYEEINCPSISEVVFMVDGGYSSDEILKAERFMLSMLEFNLGAPGPLSFLRRISKADDYDLPTRTLAKYFIEVTIMDERFVGLPSSYIAAGAHCLSRYVLKKGDWTPYHVHYSGYTWNQLAPLVGLLMSCCQNAQQHHAAVFEKYADKRYKRASTTVQTELATGIEIPSHRGQFIPYGSHMGPSDTSRAFLYQRTD